MRMSRVIPRKCICTWIGERKLSGEGVWLPRHEQPRATSGTVVSFFSNQQHLALDFDITALKGIKVRVEHTNSAYDSQIFEVAVDGTCA